MGSGETKKPTKEKEVKTPPATTSLQEHPSASGTATGNPEWLGYQAYTPIPPHGFLASSPKAHPYMWGVQPVMSPYGTPPHPYVAMYPHGGVYAHPSIPPGSYPFSPFAMPSPNGIPEASGNLTSNMEANGKPSDAKEKLPIKRSKGSLGSLNMITGKNNDIGKTSGGSANGVSKSGESASEGASEGSDTNSQNESESKSGRRQSPLEASQNGSLARGPQNGSSSTPHTLVNPSMALMPAGVPPGPATNLNIGMEYWGSPASPAIPAIHGKVPSAPAAGDGAQSALWLQDEREIKRLRRKQSNRESARRSRLRKQAECDELAQRAESLKEENESLRAEVNRIKSEYERLTAENASLKEKLGETPERKDSGTSAQDQHSDNSARQTNEKDVAQDGQ